MSEELVKQAIAELRRIFGEKKVLRGEHEGRDAVFVNVEEVSRGLERHYFLEAMGKLLNSAVRDDEAPNRVVIYANEFWANEGETVKLLKQLSSDDIRREAATLKFEYESPAGSLARTDPRIIESFLRELEQLQERGRATERMVEAELAVQRLQEEVFPLQDGLAELQRATGIEWRLVASETTFETGVELEDTGQALAALRGILSERGGQNLYAKDGKVYFPVGSLVDDEKAMAMLKRSDLRQAFTPKQPGQEMRR